MKFVMAVIVQSLLGLLLTWGILQAVHGSYWLLIAGTLAYIVVFLALGVLGLLALFALVRLRVHHVARRFFHPFINVPRTTQGAVPLVSPDEAPVSASPE